MVKLKQLFGPSVFDDEETNRVSRILRIVLLMTLASVFLVALINLAIGNLNSVIPLLVGEVLLLIPLWLVRRGHLQAAGLLLLGTLLIVVTYVLHTEAGIHDVGTVTYPVVIVFASLLLRRRGLIFLTILTILAVGYLALGEMWGWFVTKPISQQALLADWITESVVLGVMALTVGIMAYDLRKNLLQARQEITERKQVEEALRRSQQLFSSMFHVNPAATILSTLVEGKCVDVNEAYAKLVGYMKEELVGKTTLELNIWTTAEERQRVVTDLAQKGHLENVELTLRRKEGELINTVAAGKVITLDGQKYILSFFFDITERKQAVEALRQSKALYQSLVEVMPMSLCRKDLEGHITFANSRFCTDANQALDDIVGKTDFDLHPSELATKYRHDDQRVIKTGQMFETVEMRSLLGGEKSFVQVLKSPVRDPSGNITGVQIMFWDVTERKRAEDALWESESKFHRIIEQSSDAIVLTNEQGSIIEWNRGAEQITGIKRAEALGHPTWEVQFQLIPEDRRIPATYEYLKSVALALLKTGQTPGLNQIQETDIYHLDGMRRTVQTVVFSTKTAQGFMTGTIIRDVTQLKRAEEELRQANEKLHLQLTEIQNLQSLLREQALRDPLTGLYNRRHLDEVLEHELARSIRESYPVSFIMVDIDFFKNVNDTYGHAVGDLMLQDLAHLLTAQIRASDFACRYGGEEFLLVLPNTSTEAARQCAERCRLSFQDYRLHIGGTDIHTTLSFGIATFPLHGATSKEILGASDRALYMAKSSGRNCVAVWPAPSGN